MRNKKNINELAILLGNGFNIAKSIGQSWADLMTDLGSEYDIDIKQKINNPFRPFPILLEDVVLRRDGVYEDDLKLIKERIANIFEKIEPTALHSKLMKSNIKTILTTNYDYVLEKVLIPNFGKSNFIPSETKEYVYSLERKRTIGGRNIWHIHGELYTTIFDPRSSKRYPEQSILIGFEQYAEYLARIRNSFAKRKFRNRKFKNIDDTEITQWIDVFFTHDLHILGLSLDVSENHLWSLLNYRAKLLKGSNQGKDKFNNQITFVQTIIPHKNNNIETHNNKLKQDAIKEMLESLGVKVIRESCNNKQEVIDYYHSYLDKLIE